MEHRLFIRNYEIKDELSWDKFVLEDSVNGTFLQTRRFLNYHPENRFVDSSYIIEDINNNIVAVYPACLVSSSDGVTLISHQGSTFGGFIISNKWYTAEKVLEIIEVFENEIKSKCDKVILKITPDLFSRQNSALLEYCLYLKNYSLNFELNSYIDYSEYSENLLSEFAQGKRTNVNNCLKAGLTLRKLTSNDEIKSFYRILCHTLEKFDKKPVHSVEELLLLKNNILQNECEFFGAFLDGKMIAGAMMFLFNDIKVAHTQYLCALHEYDKLSPMTFMYYSMIKEYKENKYKYISFGITSEHDEKKLNFGLTKSKESYGSIHSLNLICEKKFAE